MKYIYTILGFLLLSMTIQAQTIDDAWRYSQNMPTGTARFTAMSGAFSSLGGDMSAVSLNPAGATTFTTNRFTGTLSFFNTQNEANYFGTTKSSDYTSFDDQIIGLNQMGVVWVFKSDVSDWNKIAMTINYNKDVDYGNELKITGINPKGHSVTDYFVNNANGFRLDDLQEVDGLDDDYQWLGENYGFAAQQAYLAYQAYIINPVDAANDNNTQYTANAVYTNVHHKNNIYTTGSKSHLDFAVAGTYKNKLQLGFSLAAYSVDYVERNRIEEDGYNSTSDLQYLKFRNTLRAEGSGLALKFGGIYKISKGVKLSLAYHSPEWLEINEYMKQSIYTERINGNVYDLSPVIENEFAPYRIITPSKWIAGASFVVNKQGLISVDYTYQDMGSMHFKELDDDADTTYFDNLNDDISNTFQAVHKLNVGGELKLDALSLRAGGFTTTSPFKDDSELNTTTGYSLGMGFDFGGIVIDAAYMRTDTKTRQYLLTLPDAAEVDITKNKFLVGVRYNF